MTESHQLHCVKSVRIRSFFWSVFSCIQTEYRKIRTRKNSVFRYFSPSAIFTKKVHRCLTAEVYSEPNQPSKMGIFAKTVNGFHPFAIFPRSSMLDARLGGFWIRFWTGSSLSRFRCFASRHDCHWRHKIIDMTVRKMATFMVLPVKTIKYWFR